MPALTLAYSTTTGDAHARAWRPLDEKVAAILARNPRATVYEIAGLLGDGGVPYRLIEDTIRHITNLPSTPVSPVNAHRAAA